MGGPLLVILADIHMIRSENAVVRSVNSSFYKRFVDDIYTKRSKHTDDLLLKKFLDTKTVLNRHGAISTFVSREETKSPLTWISKSPKRYKQNTIISDLHRSKRILPDFDTGIRAIKNKYSNAGYPIHFIASIVNNFNLPHEDDVLVTIPPNLFDEMKPFLLIEVPCCEINEKESTHFIKMFHRFTT